MYIKKIKTSVAVALALTAGCASAPVQQMSDARQAISAARAAGAENHAPTQLAAAAEYLDGAERALQQHEYRVARRQAEQARMKAIAALQVSMTTDK